MELALEAGADDIQCRGDNFEITSDPEKYADVLDALERAGIEPDVKEITQIPNSTVVLDVENGRKVLKLMEELDDHDDVQSVSANFDIPDDVMAVVGDER